MHFSNINGMIKQLIDLREYSQEDINTCQNFPGILCSRFCLPTIINSFLFLMCFILPSQDEPNTTTTTTARRLSILKQPLFSTLNQHLIDYPTPSNISYWWGFGSLAGLCLVIQIITGVFLAMHYTPHVDLAFNSVEHIMRDVKGGWLLRYMHANGASMFFTVVYIHIFRGLYYGSYTSPREFIWCLGVVIFLLMIVTAFIGYVLPWGQMSFWGATVITSLASAIPVVGDTIVTWLWGGFSVDNATLNRFFSLHYLLPFVIVGASLIHLAALHQYGSNNPLGINSSVDKIAFYPYLYVKDLVGWVAFAIFFSIWLFYAPNVLGHPDNYMPANPMSTPAHIVPEWYFLPIYAILRSIPNKLGGVAAIGLVFASLLALPFLNTSAVRSSSFRLIYVRMFWLLLADCLLLGWIGCQPVEAPYVTIGQMASVVFFSYFAITPILGQIEARLIIHADDTTCRHLLIMNADYRLPAFHTFEELPAIGETRRIRHRKHIFHLFRGMATSSAPGEDFSDPLDRPSLVERLENDVHDLKDISSSLEKAGRVTPEHLKGLDEAFQTVEREDFPDLEFCVKNTSEIQCKNNGGVDPTGDLAKLTLEKMDAALTGVPWTAHDILLPLKGSLKRTAPGEGEARAAQLQNFIEEKSIPAIEGVKEAYRHLSTVTREAYWAGLSSDSEGEVSGPVPGGESSSGGGENLRSGPTETEDPSGSGEDPGSGPTGAGGSGAGPVPSVFEDDGWIERAIESIKSFL